MYARVGVYAIKPGRLEEVVQKVEAGQVPIIRQQPGFVSYELIRTGADSCVTISRWGSEAEAEASRAVAAVWVREHLAELIADSQTHTGEIAIAASQ